jgi:16S rRNA (cytosine967-C5)-methyltransferase
MVYATCTVHPRENGAVIDAFLARRPELVKVLQQQWWPGEGEKEGDAAGGGDGFFAAVLRN